jgi:hypothetical protein
METMHPATFIVTHAGNDTLETGSERIPCVVLSVRDSSSARGKGGVTLQWRDARGAIWREKDPGIGSILERTEISSVAEPAGLLDAMAWRPLPFEGVPPSSPPCEVAVLPAEPAPDGSVAGDPAPFPEGPGQRVFPGETPGSWRLRIARPAATAATEADRLGWRERGELSAALASDLIVDADDSSVREFALAATRGAGSPTEEALLLERAVHERIAIRDLGTVLATASQTLAAGRGDCTEHAVLLAACCRARGIPARLIAGIVPAGDRMLFHLWTEVYLNEWASLDATLGLGSAAPCAIALARWEHLEEEVEGFTRSFERIAGRYRFRLEDVTR